MKKAELVFIPVPGVGHLVSTVEIAKLLVAQDHRLSISILILKLSGYDSTVSSYTQSLASSVSERIKFIELPDHQTNPSDLKRPTYLLSSFYENLKPYVRNVVTKLVESELSLPNSPRLAGFVVDLFCTAMIDVASEFGVPSYVFFTSGAGFFSLMTHLQALSDEQNKDITEYNDELDAELVVPGFKNPVPAKVLPSVVVNKEASPLFLSQFRKTRKTKGVLVNTFVELESHMIQSIPQGDQFPQIYTVGPILNFNPIGGHFGGTDDNSTTDIVTWLDSQPPLSVVFLCFGSMGSFNAEQVKEIACALEHSGVRFLWSLRKPPEPDGVPMPSNYTDPNEVLPEGFSDRTAGIGRVIGWAPQVTVLAHPAIGGFVSHCGWNSILESLWFGVPIATWPLAAEQQINAFKMVREFELAVEIKLDYRKDFLSIVSGKSDPSLVIVKAEEIEGGITKLMEHDSDIRKRVKEMSEKSKKALPEGGSSYSALCRFISDVIDHMP